MKFFVSFDVTGTTKTRCSEVDIYLARKIFHFVAKHQLTATNVHD